MNISIRKSREHQRVNDRMISTIGQPKSHQIQEMWTAANQELPGLTKIVEHVSEGIALTDSDGIIKFANAAYEHITGFELAEIVDRPLFREEAVPGFSPLPVRVRESLELTNSWSGVVTSHKKSGEQYREHRTLIHLEANHSMNNGLICVAYDATDRQHKESRNLQSKKMETVGTLTSEIAHNLKNILTPLLGYAELLKDNIDPNSRNSDDLDIIHQAAIRARDLSSQILNIGRPSVIGNKVTNLKTIMEEVLDLFQALIPHNISLNRNLIANAAMVPVDESEIHIILLNLLTNACQAMPNGGSLNVGLKVISLNSYPKFETDNGQLYRACISVKDTGIGMDKTTIRNCFRRDFTTKHNDEGTGVGLFSVAEIVNRNKGSILLESTIGEGSLFNIYFPICVGDRKN